MPPNVAPGTKAPRVGLARLDHLRTTPPVRAKGIEGHHLVLLTDLGGPLAAVLDRESFHRCIEADRWLGNPAVAGVVRWFASFAVSPRTDAGSQRPKALRQGIRTYLVGKRAIVPGEAHASVAGVCRDRGDTLGAAVIVTGNVRWRGVYFFRCSAKGVSLRRSKSSGHEKMVCFNGNQKIRQGHKDQGGHSASKRGTEQLGRARLSWYHGHGCGRSILLSSNNLASCCCSIFRVSIARKRIGFHCLAFCEPINGSAIGC
mmetsp:Transcript_16477/g.33875  ORF Transcript_16477/g.33875 Transcript_16477/m.33875 type:complete len:259 (+) Transcript_16477:1293-2069(+)